MTRALLVIAALVFCVGIIWAQEPSIKASRTGLRIHDLGTLCIYEANVQSGVWGITKEQLRLAPSDSCPGRPK